MGTDRLDVRGRLREACAVTSAYLVPPERVLPDAVTTIALAMDDTVRPAVRLDRVLDAVMVVKARIDQVETRDPSIKGRAAPTVREHPGALAGALTQTPSHPDLDDAVKSALRRASETVGAERLRPPSQVGHLKHLAIALISLADALVDLEEVS